MDGVDAICEWMRAFGMPRSAVLEVAAAIEARDAELRALRNQVAAQAEMLTQLHEHVHEACQLLDVDTAERMGDSWTLVEVLRGRKRRAAEGRPE